MPATMLSGFSTTYQRAVLSTLTHTGAQWLPSFDGSAITRTILFGAAVGQFEIVFWGTGLTETGSVLTGSVVGMDLYQVTGSFPRPKVAEITGLNIPDFGAFVTNAQTLANTEPDFNDTDVAAFFAAITPSVINGSPDDDFIEAGPGLTDIHAGKGNDVVLAGPGGGLIDMGRGNRDALDFRNVSNGIDADLGTGTISSGAIGWSVSGVKVLFGSNLADTLVGGGGGDKIFGRAGDDRILGLGGNDILKGDDGDDRIFGGTGNDNLLGQKGNDILRGGDGNDRLEGQSGRDKLFGENGADTFFGGSGRDKLFGGKGKDDMSGGKGADVLLGEGGNDTLYGVNGPDVLKGGGGNDKLFGGSGDDTLSGGHGDDEIAGGSDDDLMSGGSGSDKFIFSADFGGVDTILDFEKGMDKIEIFGQTAPDVTISEVIGTGNQYMLTYDAGTIFVTVAGVSDALTFDDLVFL